MKKILSVSCLFILTLVSNAQNYNDLFTTYESVVPTPSKSRSCNSYIVPQYDVLDVDEFNRRIEPQNVQTVTGVTIRNGQLFSVKLRVGISGTNHNQMLVTEYWDGSRWNSANGFAWPIGYGAPDQIRMACEYEANITGVGKVYF